MFTHQLSEIKKPAESKTPSKPKNIVFFNYVNDGLGDIGHLVDIANPETLDRCLPKTDSFGKETLYQPICVIACDKPTPQRLRFIIHSLLENKIATDTDNPHDLNDTSQLSNYIATFLKTNSHIHLCKHGIANEYIMSIDDVAKQDHFQDQMKNACAAFQISNTINSSMIFKDLNNALALTVNIREHWHCFLKNSLQQYTMGCSKENCGILLKTPSCPTLKEKTNALFNISHKKYLSALLEQKEITKETTEHFLETTLFVPGYLQEPLANAAMIQILAISNIAKQYAHITFHINGKALDTHLLTHELLAEHGIEKIIICRPDQDPEIQLIAETTGKRCIKIMAGYELNYADYRALYASAQIFGGSSGDKTFELVLSNGLIPFHAEPHQKGVALELANIAEEKYGCGKNVTKYITYFAALNNIDSLTSTLPISQLIDENFVSEWKNLTKEIHANHNLYNTLPAIFQYSLQIHDLALAVQQKNRDVANKLLSQYNLTHLVCIASWAADHDQRDLATFIYTKHKDYFSSLTLDKSFIETLDYFLIQSEFDIEAKENIESKCEKEFLTRVKNALIYYQDPTALSRYCNFFKFTPTQKNEFINKLTTLLTDSKLDTRSQFIEVTDIILQKAKNLEIDGFFYTLLGEIFYTDSILPCYFNIPRAIYNAAERENSTYRFRWIPDCFPQALPIVIHCLEQKASDVQHASAPPRKKAKIE